MNLLLLEDNMIESVTPRITNLPPYSVGVTPEGLTQLIVCGDFGSSILTMHPNAVETMIRLLEATLNDN